MKPTITHCLDACKLVSRVNYGIMHKLSEKNILAANRKKISVYLKSKQLRLNTMLGILPDDYYADLGVPGITSEALKERWAQAARASEILSDHAMGILQEWLQKIWTLSQATEVPLMGWYHTSRATGYQ